jgi:hypothetical protein
MRKISLIYLLGLLLAACGAGQPQLELEADRLALGDVVNGEIVDRDVTVFNRGAGDLVVDAVSTSCGCTSATLEPMTIPPGGSAVLHIEFDSGAHGPELTGTLIRQVFIASNDPQRPEVILEIEAEILPPVLP